MSNPLHMALEIAQWRTVPVYDGLHSGQEQDGPDGWFSDFACLFNLKHPEWSLSQLCEVLLELQRWGFIYFFRNHTSIPLKRASQIEMNRETLTKVLKLSGKEHKDTALDINSVYYALTPEGGACWEEAAQADWNRYLSEESAYSQTWASVFRNINRETTFWPDAPGAETAEFVDGDNVDWTDDWKADPKQVLLSSINRDLIENWFAIDVDRLKIVVPNPRQDGEVRPWHPFYWKTLPFAYRIGYTLYSQNERLTMDIPYKTDEEIDALNLYIPNWYRSVFPPYEPSN